MNAVDHAIQHFGSQAAMAGALNIKQPTVSEWRRGDRPVPVERCVEIERLTDRKVRRWHLRPTDWHLIWPELADHPDAPAQPAVDQPKAA